MLGRTGFYKENNMIYGNVNNEFFDAQAALLPAPLCGALHYLKEQDLAHHEAGKFDIQIAGVPMILQVLDLETSPREALRPEIHRHNIDVQFLAAGGPEEAGYYNDDGTNEVDEDLLKTPRDILFYKNNPKAAEGRIALEVGTYAVYLPWDVHIPAIQAGDQPAHIRKIVIKVPIAACLPEGTWKF
jgi:YhcH/YjgK/YiaL family protein